MLFDVGGVSQFSVIRLFAHFYKVITSSESVGLVPVTRFAFPAGKFSHVMRWEVSRVPSAEIVRWKAFVHSLGNEHQLLLKQFPFCQQ